MSGNGSNDGPSDRQQLVRIGRGYSKSVTGTPEQGCLGCILGAAAILVAALFWAWFFWRQYQAENTPTPAPPQRYSPLRPQ